MFHPCVIREIPRPPADVAAALAELGVATVHEAQARRGLLRPGVRRRVPGGAVCGPAVTALNHPGDNLMLHAAIAVAQPGDVIVVACTAPCTDGMLGELLAVSCKARGVAGVVLDGGVRDLGLLQEIGLPVWSRAVSAAGTAKATPGWVNVPVVCGGAAVRPGDLVVADDDGVAIVAAEHAEAVLAAGRGRAAQEAAMRKRLARGELTLQVYGFDEVLAAKGVRFYATAADAADQP